MFKINGRKIGPGEKPFIIAEMSGNHNQSIERAFALIEAAAKAGVDALKIQTYTADTMTLDIQDGDFAITDKDSLWAGYTLHKLYSEAYTPWEWHKSIFNKCAELGIIGFSTPFDPTAVDFLETLNVPLYKVASFEVTDLPLIEKIAKTGKPMIISTGMASIEEIQEAYETAVKNGCPNVVLLKCTSSYPASPLNSNVSTIPHMRELFKCQIGLSDHTMGVGCAVAAVAMGATVLEKHFTLKRSDGGVDSAFSLEPAELASLVIEVERAQQSIGVVTYGASQSEKASLAYRRSLYIAQDLKAGDVLTEENLRIVRPGFGLAPKYYKSLLGRHVLNSVKKGTPASWDLISE